MSILQARNEVVIHAHINISKVWAIIPDINLLPKVNPGVLSASGRLDRQGESRTCEFNNGGRKGTTMIEKFVEVVPEKKTLWTIESDTMGMSKMLKGPLFCFYLKNSVTLKPR